MSGENRSRVTGVVLKLFDINEMRVLLCLFCGNSLVTGRMLKCLALS